MTIHMLRFASPADTASFLINSYIPQWLISHQAWEGEGPNDPPTLQAADDEHEYYTADWRFAWSADKEVLIANIDQYTAAYTNWHRIGYHVCDHDGENRSGCEWDEWRESGTVPAWVPGGNSQ